MAHVRLFANLRELAGTSSVELSGATVGEVLALADAEFGEAFATGVAHSKVWLNGEPAAASDEVTESDEIAVIPPVSGGQAARIEEARSIIWVVAAAVVLAGVNSFASAPVFAAALVGITAVWAVDVWRETREGGLELQLAPVLAAVTVGAVAALGAPGAADRFSGFGIVLAFSVIGLLAWAVIVPESRDLTVVGVTLTVQLLAGFAVASLVMLRIGDGGAKIVGVFLIQVIVAGLATTIASRLAIPYLDPYVAGAAGAVAAGLVAAFVWDLSILAYLLVGAVVALALIAGRGFGAMCRTGEVYLVDRPPGLLSDFDGPVMAAAIFLPILLLVS